MDPARRRPYGLRPTLRPLMILVVYFAALFAVIRPEIRGFPLTPKAVVSFFLINLFLSFLILGLLDRLLDRLGLVRD